MVKQMMVFLVSCDIITQQQQKNKLLKPTGT